MMPDAFYIGLMSGTSLDGVDAVLASFDGLGQPKVHARASQAFPEALRAEFLSLNHTNGQNELARAALAANALADVYAGAVGATLIQAGLPATRICAIGAHGQTVRHQPAQGFTIQLNAPARLAELTGISVVADFRSRDVAAGGQGAPLVPMFHAGVFACKTPRVVLNLGGIANITILRPDADPIGFDTGPANVLMDLWCQRNTGASYDAEGAWGAGGSIHAGLCQHLLESEPWFDLPAPKSTGRDLFHQAWLEQRLLHISGQLPTAGSLDAQDIQATLRALTAQSVARAIRRYAPDVVDVLVCGGGARNAALMQDLQLALGCPVQATDTAGIETQDVEALAFAWLAWAHQRGLAASHPAVTGARGARILGATWPA
jgi:anhydro-N-acetylmuramic acid kinase